MLAIVVPDQIFYPLAALFTANATAYATWLAIQIMKIREDAKAAAEITKDHGRRIDRLERVLFE